MSDTVSISVLSLGLILVSLDIAVVNRWSVSFSAAKLMLLPYFAYNLTLIKSHFVLNSSFPNVSNNHQYSHRRLLFAIYVSNSARKNFTLASGHFGRRAVTSFVVNIDLFGWFWYYTNALFTVELLLQFCHHVFTEYSHKEISYWVYSWWIKIHMYTTHLVATCMCGLK